MRIAPRVHHFNHIVPKIGRKNIKCVSRSNQSLATWTLLQLWTGLGRTPRTTHVSFSRFYFKSHPYADVRTGEKWSISAASYSRPENPLDKWRGVKLNKMSSSLVKLYKMSSSLARLSEFVLSSIIFLEIHSLDFIHKMQKNVNNLNFCNLLEKRVRLYCHPSLQTSNRN